MSKRLVEMDVARGLAALAVVLIHVSEIALNYHCQRDATTLAYVAIAVTARFAVPMFVLLSGMGLALSHRPNEGYLTFLRRRLKRILPAYILWSLIYSFTYVSADAIGLRLPTLNRVLQDLATGGAAYHLYFVPKIILLYIMFPGIYHLIRFRYGMVICALLSVVLTVLRYTTSGLADLGFISEIGGSISWLLFFALGIWLTDPGRRYNFKEPAIRSAILVALPVFLIGMIHLLYMAATRSQDSTGITSLMKLLNIAYLPLLTIFIWSREWGGTRLATMLRYVSDRSYGLYLSHTLVLTLFVFVYRQSGIEGNGIVYFSGSLCSVFLVCLVIPALTMRAVRNWRSKPRIA